MRGIRPLIAVPLAVSVLVAVFAWPAARLGPEDLPIGVAGPPPRAVALEQRLEAREGAFDVRRYADAAAARTAVADREAYGALVAGPDGLTVLTASAAGPPVAGLLEELAAGAQGAGGAQRARVVDVVPADPDDPRGAALSALVLPLTLIGVLTALAALATSPGALTALVTGSPASRKIAGVAAARRTATLVAASALAGLAAAAVVQAWLGALPGPWLLNAGVLALVVLAVAATVAGLGAAAGRAGLTAGAGLMILLGNPLSGVSSAPHLLPEPAGAIGQLLPPGAGGQLLRSTAFFDGASAAGPLAVLLGWAALGLALPAAARRGRRSCAAPALTRRRPSSSRAGRRRPAAA